MRFTVLLSLTALGLSLTGCQATGVRARNAELTTGPRFDENGEFTDGPTVTIPVWSSEGIKDRPVTVTPPRADTAH